MLVDHIGALLFPSQVWLRIIGRLSFPIFAYGIAEGVRYTSNFPKYILRMILAAVVSQPLFILAFHSQTGNAFFVLIYGAITLWAWRQNTVGKVCSILLLIASHFFEMSYGFYGVGMILAFGIFKERYEALVFAFVLLQAYYNWFEYGNMQVYAIFALPIIFYKPKIHITLPKYFLYYFYPLHLLLLLLIKNGLQFF